MRTLLRYLALCLLLVPFSASAQKNSRQTYTIDLTVTDKDTKEAIIMATVQLQPTGIMAVTNLDGHATLRNIEGGTYSLQVSYVGYEPKTIRVSVNKSLKMACPLTPTTLALREVSVTARQNVSGASTSSIIGRQAIDHLQASSLADVMQLIPGQLMTNTDLTAQSNLQIRTLSNNNTAAFGSSVILDGVPVSNNGVVEQGGFSATAFTGTDLRNFSADDIEEVEVIRGIPSAEYGDLTSGLMVVHSKIGVTPWQVKGKINPGLMNYSLGKGLRIPSSGVNGRGAGVLNFNLDYAQAWGDPRMKTKSFDRYTFSMGYGQDLTRRWHTDTKLRYMYAKDWNGNDPDAQDDGTESKNINKVLSLTHNGKISVDKLFSRTVSYTVGLSLTGIDNTNTSYVPTSNNVVHIVTARETGYYDVPWLNHSYLATGYTESRPGSLFAKVNNSFYIKSGRVNQRFKMGVDYHYDWNSGAGYYNADDSRPLKPNDGGRPRAFSDVPGLHQIAAYAEDNMSWEYLKRRFLRVNFGVRFTAMQPFSDVKTFALSPRLNMAVDVTKWLNIRGGIGLNSKTPGLNYLYPDNIYKDHIAMAYYMGGDTDPALYPQSQVIRHTYVQQVDYSRGLKNATTTKIELGADVKLPGNRRLSVTAYQDRTPNGFSSASQFVTYQSLQYATPADYANGIARSVPSMYWTTTGQVSNDNVMQNRGVEFDFDLGRVKPLNTNIYFSGAWQESKSWSEGQNTDSPIDLPTGYRSETTPVRLVYPSGVDYDRSRRFVNTLRLVTNIPALRMVASFTGQVIWHSSTYSHLADKDPYAFITTDLAYHDITGDMTHIWIDADGNWSQTPTAIAIDLEKQKKRPSEKEPVKEPITWNLSARLTKEFGKFAGLSFYANNVLYYEPFMTTSTSGTLTQRNTSSYSFGVELFFNL